MEPSEGELAPVPTELLCDDVREGEGSGREVDVTFAYACWERGAGGGGMDALVGKGTGVW